jgi:hypothetical protein
MTNEELEEYIYRGVADIRLREILLVVLERLRRLQEVTGE